jgi:hypothetical protein
VSQFDNSAPTLGQAPPGKEVARLDEFGVPEWADLRTAVSWARRHRVLLAGFALIALQLAWKAQFLSHLYFRQDDFHDLDLAIEHPQLSWRYLSYIGSGHLIIGLRVIAWALVRVSGPYNWGLASAVTLALVAAASLAALRLLGDLFGERPAILIPLGVYLLTPLTLPDIGIWSSAMESVPLQLAIFMALSAHLRYVRTERLRHLVAAGCWVAFGLVFFEKGLVLPLLLFAITAAFLTDRRTLLAGSLSSMLRYWKAWAVYGALMLGYVGVLAAALRTSATQPKAPVSYGTVVSFALELVRDTLLPGAFGGPWKWYPAQGATFAFGAAPPALVALSAIAFIVVVGASVLYRRVAWRAWAILLGWVAIADILPVVIGRLNTLNPNDVAVLGLETRYLADAAPVLAVCVGLAFLPLDQAASVPQRRGHGVERTSVVQFSRNVVAVLVGVFVIGSVWSAQAYENVTSGQPYATYMANAAQALKLAPRGTPVFNVAVDGNLVEGLFGVYSMQSKVIGDIQPGKLRWLTDISGTIDGLRIFGPDGRLYQAYVRGTSSVPLPASRKCFPVRHQAIIVPFQSASPSFSGMLRIGYLSFSPVPGTVSVSYGTTTSTLTLQHGLHAAYMPVAGSASQITIIGVGTTGLCVGDAQAGNLKPSPIGQVLPPLAK